jgi:hypothetical protein
MSLNGNFVPLLDTVAIVVVGLGVGFCYETIAVF